MWGQFHLSYVYNLFIIFLIANSSIFFLIKIVPHGMKVHKLQFSIYILPTLAFIVSLIKFYECKLMSHKNAFMNLVIMHSIIYDILLYTKKIFTFRQRYMILFAPAETQV